MKTSVPFICVLICFAPAFLAGQTPLTQEQPFRSPLLAQENYAMSSFSSSMDAKLRVLRLDDPPDMDIIAIDVGDIVVAPYRPRIQMRKPLIMGPQSAIVVSPSEGRHEITLTNLGVNGLNGIRRLISNAALTADFFQTDYDVSAGTITHTYADDTDAIMLGIISDKALPKLTEKLMSTTPGYTDIMLRSYTLNPMTITTSGGGLYEEIKMTYSAFQWDQNINSTDPMFMGSPYRQLIDLGTRERKESFGDLHVVKKYDVASSKLQQSVLKGGLDDRFEIELDLVAATERRDYGNEDLGIQFLYIYDKAIPKLTEKVLARNVALDDGLWYIRNLAEGSVTTRFEDLDSDIQFTSTYDKATPKLTEQLSSTNPMFDDVFLTTYKLSNLEIARSGNDLFETVTFLPETFHWKKTVTSTNMGFTGSPYTQDVDIQNRKKTDSFGDLHIEKTYDIAVPKLQTRMLMDGIPEVFSVEYDLTSGIELRDYGDPGPGISFVTIFDKDESEITEKIAMRNVALDDVLWYLHNLAEGSITTRFADDEADILLTCIYDKAVPKLTEKLSSTIPGTAETFEFTQDLSLGKETKIYGDGVAGMQVTVEYEKASPKLLTHLSSTDPILSDIFFETSYDLPLGKTRKLYKEFVLEEVMVSDGVNAKLIHTVGSEDGMNNLNWNFTTDVATGERSIAYDDLHYTQIYDPDHPQLLARYESMRPEFAGRSLSILSSLTDGSVVDITRAAKVPGADSLSEITSYKMTGTRQVEHLTLDVGTGAELRLIHRPDPLESLLIVQGSLQLDGGDLTVTGTLSNDGGALVLDDDVDLTGSLSSSSGDLMLSDAVTITGTLSIVDAEVSNDLTIAGSINNLGGAVLLADDLHVTGPISNPDGILQMIDDVQIMGNLTVIGTKAFKIDHPLDPDNKYLFHSCIESPDIMNVYNGNVMTDASGVAVVQLPAYFEALNIDYRYQLTCMGTFAQAIIAEKIKDNAFVIQTDKPNVEVSWQVTGIRNDPAAVASGYRVEVEK